MKKLILFLMLCLPLNAFADEELQGDTKLACEALLCLSSGDRPSECDPALSRYFGISRKKWKDTLSARRSFLNQCPTASATGMPSLIEAILNGAGQCTAALLNKTLLKQVVIKECIDEEVWWSLSKDDRDALKMRCRDKTIVVINNRLPAYCKTYADHEYTYNIGVRYVGDPLQGGHWVDE